MDAIAIKVNTREALEKSGARACRRAGRVPGVLYGEGRENEHVDADPRDVIRILRSDYGPNTMLKLQVNGDPEQLAVIRDYQVHPFKRKLLHVDFLRVTPDTEITAAVPVRLLGRSQGEQRGCKLILVARDIKLRCRAGSVPKHIDIDVTEFEEGYTFYSDQLELPEGVTAAYRTNFPIASVTHLRTAEEEAEEEEGAEGETTGEGGEADGEKSGQAETEA